MLRTFLTSSLRTQRLVIHRTAIRTLSYSAIRHDELSDKGKNGRRTIPKDMLREIRSSVPKPMRNEFSHTLSTEELRKIEVNSDSHYVPQRIGDRLAYRIVRILRLLPDLYFRDDHYMRALMLETIAAVPGMVGGMQRHMRSLSNLKPDTGWIIHLLHEAENERMHLMIFMKCIQPNFFNRLLILFAQGVFFNSYLLLYCISSQTAHRFTGYLEEEAIHSYTHFLNDLEAGKIPDRPAPQLSIDYYNLLPSATIRDVVLAVRADEALHRDANHYFSDRIAHHDEDLTKDIPGEDKKEQ
ncbi:alternative oxidase-domain-containing protein [Radiomyces spectabilis]|uniref:alternative oxidase-domain-containing protein n=1 Tax=Radiomyces spectabilis TaxID=64574 RepID=UPI00221EFE1D|nr:alternative oxidase-domain-containing protein [Radiomyces spectabilis]KAI8391119.1 alternative oxidase-domain-containing protein [Radiomyces spectabilis]